MSQIWLATSLREEEEEEGVCFVCFAKTIAAAAAAVCMQSMTGWLKWHDKPKKNMRNSYYSLNPTIIISLGKKN